MIELEALTRAVRWRGGRLEVIDQTRLPGELVVRTLDTADEVVDAIRRLVVRGAPAIGVCGAYGMVVGLDEAAPQDGAAARAVLGELSQRIGAARPTAVNLGWAVRRVAAAGGAGSTPAEVRELALAAAEAIRAADEDACRRIGEAGRGELAAVRRVLTHCNTGRLATAGIGTALGVVYAKAAAGEAVEVLACETRPLLQGTRLTAWELAEAGIPVTVLPDAAAATAFAHGLAEAVVVGCDRVARNGDTANKVGTYTHSVLARRHRVPFYVAGPMSSFDPDTPDGAAIEIEQRASGEVLPPGAFPGGVDVLNPAFDVTPAELVTAFITDEGVLRPPFDAAIGEALARAERNGRR